MIFLSLVKGGTLTDTKLVRYMLESGEEVSEMDRESKHGLTVVGTLESGT